MAKILAMKWEEGAGAETGAGAEAGAEAEAETGAGAGAEAGAEAEAEAEAGSAAEAAAEALIRGAALRDYPLCCIYVVVHPIDNRFERGARREHAFDASVF